MGRYLVTGGCGFIGSHLVDALVQAGHGVVVLDDLSTGTTDHLPAAAALLRGSVADRDLAARALSGVDGCFHLAAIASVQQSTMDLLGTHRTNLGGTLTVLDAVAGTGRAIPVVYASSAAVYGDCPDCPIREASPKRPQSAYGADKLASELHAAVATHTRGTPTTGLRFFNVYGPRQPPGSPYSGVVSIFADRISNRRPVTIFGDGGQTRDFIHVSDVVRALLGAMRRALPGAPAFNVATGRATSVLDLAAALGRLCGTAPELRFAPGRVGEIRHSVGDASAARASLELGDCVALEDGLASLLA